MKERWLVAIVGLPLLLLVLLACPPWATMLLMCAVSGAAAYELLHVTGKNVPKQIYGVTILCAAGQVAITYDERAWYYVEGLIPYGSGYRAPFCPLWVLPFALTTAVFLFSVVAAETGRTVAFQTVAAALVGGIVFPMMYSCVVLLRMHEDYGRLYVLAPFFAAFAGDSLALYFGKWFGKKKMAPHVSPNKTWAGFFGHILGSILGLLLFGVLGARWLGYSVNWFYLVHNGLVASLFGQLGDLSTSLIKREAGVKDYSRLFLTHGGVLDRFDSLLFIAPILYYFLSTGML